MAVTHLKVQKAHLPSAFRGIKPTLKHLSMLSFSGHDAGGYYNSIKPTLKHHPASLSFGGHDSYAMMLHYVLGHVQIYTTLSIGEQTQLRH